MVLGPEERRERFQRDFDNNPSDIVQIDDPSDVSSEEDFQFLEINENLEDDIAHESKLDPETGFLIETGSKKIDDTIPDTELHLEQRSTNDPEQYGCPNYLHKKYRTTLNSEITKTYDNRNMSIENALVTHQLEEQPNLEVTIRRCKTPNVR